MAKRKAAPEDDDAATSPSRAGAKPPEGSVYIGADWFEISRGHERNV